MAPTIPPEIWLRTAQFIPPSYLQYLYPVNSLFLDLALNERYRDVNLAVIWIGTPTTKRLEHLSQPHIARRVRRLTLASDWLQSNFYIYLSRVQNITFTMAVAWRLPGFLGQFIDQTARNRFLIEKCNARMERIVVNFPNLSSLSIVEGYGTAYQTDPSKLLVKACTASASNLRTLSLCANTFNITPLFPPNPSELTSLEEVTFTLSPPNGGTEADFGAASTFFQGIASTLTTLNITFKDTCNEPSQLLQSIPCQGGKAVFPKLTSLSLFHLGIPATEPQGPHVVRFLNNHADTLKHLGLQLPTPSLYASRSLGDLAPLVLPHLETLDVLKFNSSWNREELASRGGLDAVRAYIQYSGSTLTHLSLTLCMFTLHDLGILLNLLARGSSENAEGARLKSLSVNVQVLSPQVLDALAERLPQLEKLTVGFAHLRSSDVPATPSQTGSSRPEDLKNEDVESFNLEMQTRSYSGWRLRSFGIDRGPHLPKEKPMSVLMPLTQCIPCLVEINGPILMWREPGGSWSLRDSEIW